MEWLESFKRKYRELILFISNPSDRTRLDNYYFVDDAEGLTICTITAWEPNLPKYWGRYFLACDRNIIIDFLFNLLTFQGRLWFDCKFNDNIYHSLQKHKEIYHIVFPENDRILFKIFSIDQFAQIKWPNALGYHDATIYGFENAISDLEKELIKGRRFDWVLKDSNLEEWYEQSVFLGRQYNIMHDNSLRFNTKKLEIKRILESFNKTSKAHKLDAFISYEFLYYLEKAYPSDEVLIKV